MGQRCCLQAYDPATLNMLAMEVVEASRGGPVACVCSPDIFLALHEAAPDVQCTLLDFNPIFQVQRSWPASWYALPILGIICRSPCSPLPGPPGSLEISQAICKQRAAE
jgi:hypothetical protein